MSGLSQEHLSTAANKLIEYHRQASEKNEWTFFVDEMYAADCIYTCEYAGTMRVVADGSYYQTPGVSFISFDDDSQIVSQFDLFDLAHQMHLCDELEAAGLLSAELKQNWVLPMKQKLQDMLAHNC
jgi:hypothetical protein